MTLAKRVIERRETLKITQKLLAQAVGVTAQHISLIEQEKAAPSLALLAKLAEQLGTSVDYLICGREGITDTVATIKADKKLNLETKKALIALIEELYKG
ncbi:hypothetical protein ES703_41552 [subsurface metagenome]